LTPIDGGLLVSMEIRIEIDLEAGAPAHRQRPSAKRHQQAS
jgi:hypothetical protein